jgi:hypothetical protein
MIKVWGLRLGETKPHPQTLYGPEIFRVGQNISLSAQYPSYTAKFMFLYH